MSVDKKQSRVVYYKGEYPPNRWVWTMGGKDYLIGTYGGFHIKLNPSDRRGLRLIVCLGNDAKTLHETWNREYTAEERRNCTMSLFSSNSGCEMN